MMSKCPLITRSTVSGRIVAVFVVLHVLACSEDRKTVVQEKNVSEVPSKVGFTTVQNSFSAES